MSHTSPKPTEPRRVCLYIYLFMHICTCRELAKPFVAATTGATAAALILNNLTKVYMHTCICTAIVYINYQNSNTHVPCSECEYSCIFYLFISQKMSPLIGRFVPLAAVATANLINIPLMRQRCVVCLHTWHCVCYLYIYMYVNSYG